MHMCPLLFRGWLSVLHSFFLAVAVALMVCTSLRDGMVSWRAIISCVSLGAYLGTPSNSDGVAQANSRGGCRGWHWSADLLGTRLQLPSHGSTLPPPNDSRGLSPTAAGALQFKECCCSMPEFNE